MASKDILDNQFESRSKSNLKKARNSLNAQKNVSIIENLNFKPLEINPLPIASEGLEKNQSRVPPNSPRSRFIFNHEYKTVPKLFPSLDELEVPYIRVIGIKECIKKLAVFFQCVDYETNLIHFWFLDFITDCLWKCQDEFLLTEQYQKAVLEWVLYFFNLIRDPTQNLSRGRFLRIFKEAMIIAEEYIDTGCDMIPKPEELFSVKEENESEDNVDELADKEDTDSSLSFHSGDSDSDNSFLMLESTTLPDFPEFFKLPKNPCGCDISINSSIETLSERSLYAEEDNSQPDEDETEKIEDDNNVERCEVENKSILEENISISDFYKPDKKLHSRFEDESNLEELSKEDEEIDYSNSGDAYEWVNEEFSNLEAPHQKDSSLKVKKSNDTIKNERKISSSSRSILKLDKDKKEKRSFTKQRKLSLLDSKSETPINVVKEEKSFSRVNDEDILKAWFQYNIWEQRRKDMSDPKKGWLPTPEDENIQCCADCHCDQMGYKIEDFNDEEYAEIKQEWLNYLERHKEDIAKIDENKFINSCLLLIIKQLVYDYFYESFQFILIKLAYQAPPNLILERLLDGEWKIPKIIKDDFVRPIQKKPPPPKKEKPAKEKKADKKPDKKPDKKSDKSKDDSKLNKSDKSKKSDKNQKSKEAKPAKPAKNTEEEKEKLEQQRLEEKLLQEEKIKAYRNKTMIFPLSEAVDHEFFESIFDNWTAPVKNIKEKDNKTTKKEKKKK